MTATELWLTYHKISRANKPVTAQLIELEFQNHKLYDLEDVLEHVFRQGYVEPSNRPNTWWEAKDGHKLKGSNSVEDLLSQGLGRCQKSALKLVIADIPPAVWFSYIYIHNPAHEVVVQRVKFESITAKIEKLAHLTNYIFAEKYLPCNLRSVVYWERPCGKRVEEHQCLEELLLSGEGVSEDKALRLVIDHASACAVPSPCGRGF